MKKIMDKLASVLESIGGIAVIVMTLVVLLQVIMRYVFNRPLTWTEEFARYVFIYITFIGAGLLVYQRGHLYVEVVFNNLHPKTKSIVQLIIDIVVFGFSAYLIRSSSVAMKFATGSKTTAMQIPAQYIGLSVMIGAVFMTLFSLYNITADVKKIMGKEDKAE